MTDHKILTFDILESTNLKAKEIAKSGGELKTVVVARTQTQGRGRGKRGWHSPAGGLYFSVLLAPNEQRRPTDLAILAGVAVAQGVRELLPKSKNVSVKWPNDCLVDWKKIAGVLCENMGDPRLTACVVGIGVNINIGENDLQPFLSNPFSATSFQLESPGSNYNLDQCLDVFLKKLYGLYDVYRVDGFSAIEYLWEKNCLFIGKKLELKESGPGDPPGSVVPATVGTCIGIDESGALVLSNAKGERTAYYNGEITCFWP